MMRQHVLFSVLLFSAAGFLDTYALPLDFISTEHELEPVDPGSVLQTEQLPCFSGRSYSSIFNERQEAANCVGEHCGPNADAISESPTINNQPFKWNYPSSNQEGFLEIPVKLNFGGEYNAFSDGNQKWNNLTPNPPFNDATNDIFPSASISYLDLEEATTPDDETGTFDDHFEAVTPKKDPAPTVDQDPLTGEPIEKSCLVPPHNQLNAYLVHLIEVKTPVSYRNPQGILVSQYTSPLRNHYDITAAANRSLKYRKRVNFVFLSGKNIVPLSRYELRGWLVSQPEEPVEVALNWFENLAQGVMTPTPQVMSSTPDHFTRVWVTRVFDALKKSRSPYWVPV